MTDDPKSQSWWQTLVPVATQAVVLQVRSSEEATEIPVALK